MTFCTTQEKRGTNNSKNGTVELFHKRVKCWGVFHSVTMSNEGNRKCTEAKKRTTGTEGDLPKGVVSERTRGSRELAAPAMMVIDAFTIQMPQTAQQIKRLSCRVVKYNNSTHTHPCSVLSEIQLLFDFFGVPWGGGCSHPFTIPQAGYTAVLLVHIWECVNRG